MSEPIEQADMPGYLGGESPHVGRASQDARFDMAAEIEESKVEVAKSYGFSEGKVHADPEESKEGPPPAQAREARRLRTEEEEESG